MVNMAAISILKLALAAGVSAGVVMDDVRTRRIPNLPCIVLLGIGAVAGGVSRGWSGVADGLMGAMLGFAVFLVPYCMGGLGGGDVKLMAGFGALTGLEGILPALFLVSIAGAATAVLCLLTSRLQGRPVPAAIPYAPAIAAGSLLVAFGQMGAR
jgi:prepilin peptidase CpaA